MKGVTNRISFETQDGKGEAHRMKPSNTGEAMWCVTLPFTEFIYVGTKDSLRITVNRFIEKYESGEDWMIDAQNRVVPTQLNKTKTEEDK